MLEEELRCVAVAILADEKLDHMDFENLLSEESPKLIMNEMCKLFPPQNFLASWTQTHSKQTRHPHIWC